MARLPLQYSLRNITRHTTRTALTVLGLGLALASVAFMLAFSRSLTEAVRHTGDPDNMIVISKKAQDLFELSLQTQKHTVYPLNGMGFSL